MEESQSCHDKTLEQVSGLTTLSVNCTGSELGTEKANMSNFGVNDNQSQNLEKEIGFESWNDGFVPMGAKVDVESHDGEAVAVENETEINVVSDGNRMDGNGVSIMEQVGADGITMEEDALGGNDLSQTGKEGISLTVEVFGPLNGTCQLDNPELEEGGSESIPSSTRNSHVEGVANPAEEEPKPTDNQEHNFRVGDLVWAKTKTELWCPGMISNPAAATAKSDQRDGFLVKYFGSIISVWCSASQLKPFIEYFEQMSQQNKSRSFIGAVEKALLEIGQRIKREMSCSCSLKETETINATRGNLGFFSASLFEPEKFVESIRYRALDISKPGSVDFAVMKNCLSAFYSSLGHMQLSMHKLRPRNDANGGNDAKGEELDKQFSHSNSPLDCNMNEQETDISAENVNKSPKGKHKKSFELRERKKSKYLSYPYVNSWDKKNSASCGVSETEDHKGDSHAGADTKNTVEKSEGSKPSGKKPRKKFRKSRTFKSIYGKVENIDTSSTQMLQELQLTALDCFHPNESKDSSSVLNFFYSFRKNSFLNHDFTSEDNSQQQNSSNNLKGSEGDKLQLAPSSIESKGRGKKQKEVMNQTCPENGSLLTDKQNTVEKGKVRRKRKKMETSSPGKPEIKVIGGLPDLNGNNMSLSVENMEVTGPNTSKGKLEPKRAKNKEVLVSEASTDTKTSEVLQTVNTKFIPCRVENNLQFSGLSVTVKPERKKRKRKEKPSDVQNSMSAIPDLNARNTTGKGLADSSAVMSQQKRTESDVGGASGNSGSTLLLNFAPGHPLPSKESLNKTFIRFGPVVEPETQYISDSSARVVFAQSGDAEGAYQSLEKSSPFGPALASYHLNRHQAAANNSTGKGLGDLSAITSQGKPGRKRRRKATAPNIGGHTLVLNFTPGHPLPSTESLNDAFIKFGPVVETETKFLSETTAQVVFSRSSDAEVAHKSLANSSPFGPALASYNLESLPAPKKVKKAPNPTLPPVDALKLPVLPPGEILPNGEPPDLVYIKQNLEMMTAMLEKAGDNISPEMKAKLEGEVKGFLKKVSSMVGSSSTSS